LKLLCDPGIVVSITVNLKIRISTAAGSRRGLCSEAVLLNIVVIQKEHKAIHSQTVFARVYIHTKQNRDRGCNEVFFT
jgi:hypothetical protein